MSPNHRARAVAALGKPLPRRAVVHHHTYEGDSSQLVICQDRAYHSLLHRRMRALGLRPRGVPVGFTTYMMRDVDPSLMQSAKSAVVRDGISVRGLLAWLLELYVKRGLSAFEAIDGKFPR